MILPGKVIGNLINCHPAFRKKRCVINILKSLTRVGLLVAGSASGAGAETVNDFQTLQQAVLNPGINEVVFGNDITLESRLQGTTAIKRSFRVDGGGRTMNGAHPAFWFADMPSGTVSITNLTFDGLKSDKSDRYDQPIPFGPSIYFNMNDWKSQAVLNIGDGVTFRNNEAVYDSAGGAVRTAHGTVNIGDNVSFKNNMGGAGGGLYTESFTTIGDNVVFEGNEARRGGALDVIDDYTDYPDDPDYQAGRRQVKYVHIGKNALFKDNKAAFWGTMGNGGAIEVQSGELTVDDGAVFSGNTSDGTGGAISIADWSPQLPGKVTLGTVSFVKNTATYGGAIINEGDLSLNKTASFEENSASGAGGALYNSGTTVFAARATLSKNTSSTGGAVLNEGQMSFRNGGVFSGNQANADGGAVYNIHALTFGSGTVFENNTAGGDGGALYNDALAGSNGEIVNRGHIRFDGSAALTGNTAAGRGGALYNLYDVTLNPAAGEEILFRGNTDGTGANAIHMASGSRLDVTGAGTVVFDDPLSFEDTTPVLKKSGEGTLLLNAGMNDFLGSVELAGGTTRVASDWHIRNNVTLGGGSLVLPSFSFAKPDAAAGTAGGKLTIAGGTLVTNTGQLFKNPLGPDGATVRTGGLLQPVAEHMTFTSGLISFNDAKYNLQYASSAAKTLDATYAGEGEPGSKEITFTGDLYTLPDAVLPAPEPDPTPGPTGTVSVGDLNRNNVSNVVLGNTTITTAAGTDAATGNSLVVGAAYVDDERFGDAKALPGSIGGRNLHLGTEGTGVAVVGGHYLTLVGKDTGTPLIQAGNDGTRPVDVYLGGKVDGVHSPGTLNFGTVALPSGGVLRGNVQMTESSTLNVRAGEHRVTGESGDADGRVVPGVANHGGTLNIAEPATLHASVKQTAGETNVSGTLASSLVELEGGQFHVSGTAKIGRLIQQGGETAVSGTAETASLEASGGTVRVTGDLKADRLATASGTRIAIGDESAAGSLAATSVSLGGGTVFLDPMWKGNDTLETASHGALVFDNGKVDGRLAVGRNALLVLGDASTTRTIDFFNTSGLRWGPDGTTAALSILTPHRLDASQGAIVVDGAMTTAPAPVSNAATFGEGSLLVVDASGLNGKAALTSEGGVLKVARTASLLLGNATEGDYVITSGFTDNTDVTGWEGDRLSTPDQLISLSLDKEEAGTVKVHARSLEGKTVLPGVALPNILDQVWGDGRNNTESENAGIAFLSRAVDKRYVAADDTVRTLNGAAQIAVAAGVQSSTVQASDTVNRALLEHLSLSNDVTQPDGSAVPREGVDLWASVLYRDTDSSGIRAGRFNADYENDFGGILVGSDYTWKDNGNGRFRAGGALSIGKGDGQSHGDFNYTKNNYDTYGVSAYGSWNRNDTQLIVDVGYLKGDNELKQSLPGALGGKLKADLDTQVWTIGAQGEHRFKTEALDVTPHIGVRYLRLKADAFNTHNDQGTVFHTESDTQNIWQIPIGVTLSRNYVAENGWAVKPKLDVSVIPAAGDRDATTQIVVPGVGANDVTTTEIMDSTAWGGALGLDVMKDRTRFGVRVGYQKSDDARSRGAMLTVGHQFE